MESRRVGIIGTGLIGGSIGAGLRLAGWHVLGYDSDPEAVRIAMADGLVDEAAASIEVLVASDPDLVVVAAPPKATVEVVASLSSNGVIMDVAGVKAPVLAAAGHLPGFA